MTPIIYKTLKVQFAFLIKDDGTLKIKMLSPIESEKKFKSKEEAKEFIRKLKVIL